MYKRSNNGPMIPDSVYPRKRMSPINSHINMKPPVKPQTHFIPLKTLEDEADEKLLKNLKLPKSGQYSIPLPPKKMTMKREPIRPKSPFAPSPTFYDEDIEYSKNPSPLPEGTKIGPVIQTPYGDIQRVASPIPPSFNKNTTQDGQVVEPIEEHGNWGIYDTDFKGGRRKSRKSRKRRKTKHKLYKKRSRKTRKSRKNK